MRILGDPLGEHVALDGVPQWKVTAKETSVTKASALALKLMEVFFLLKRKLHKGIVQRLMADNYFHQLSSMEYAVGFICYVFVNLNFFFILSIQCILTSSIP